MIIALSGRAGCGKSTAAAYLAEHHGFARVRFAGPLKAMVRTFLAEIGTPDDVIERMIEGDLKEVPSAAFSGASPRRVMQTLGTEWGREQISSTLWTDAWRSAAKAALAWAPGVVVEDCRFENEGAAVIDAGGVIVRIERPGLAPLAGDHISERGLDLGWRVHNDGPPEILHARLDGIVRRIARAA